MVAASEQFVSIGILGPLVVQVAGVPRRPPTEIPRAVLGALLVAELPASVTHLAGLIGVGGRTASRSAVQVAVSRLRAWLRDTCHGRLRVDRLEAGYVLCREGADLDLDQFRRLAGAVAGQDPARQVELLAEALEVWRGEGLDDLPVSRRDVWALDRLRRERLGAGARLAAAALQTGQPERALPQLEQLATLDPTDEALQSSVLQLLAAAGHRVEALRRYEALRVRLRDELGVDPGPDLRRTHLRLLRDDNQTTPATARPPAGPPETHSAREIPRLLPADIRRFVGRQRETERLVDELAAGRHSGAVPVVAIAGPAGAGKAALALRVAHRIRDRFPDGQLFLDLRRPNGNPLPPRLALGRFLRGLGVRPPRIPPGLEERADLYRSLIADARLLVVLVNATGEAQVRPLVPGGSGTAVLVTSRRRLCGLAGVTQTELGPLPPAESVTLLAAVTGEARVRAEPAAAAAITAACDHLPLAIRIAGSRLAGRPHWPLEHLAGLLADDRRRLDELRDADLDLRDSLALSYLALPADQRRALRLLGLVEAAEMTGRVAAAVLDADERDALPVVDDLVAARLVEARSRPPGQFLYRLPGLVRVYAAERADLEEPSAARRAAVARAIAALSPDPDPEPAPSVPGNPASNRDGSVPSR